MLAITSSYDAIDAIVNANGNMHLAAERLQLKHGDLLALIVADPNAIDILQLQLRAMSTLIAFSSLKLVADSFASSLERMKPEDNVKAFIGLLEAINKFTDNKQSTQNVNITEIMLKMIPSDVRKAVIEVAGQTIP